MCEKCGCGENQVTHEHHHEHIDIEKNILEENDRFASENRKFFHDKKSFCLNFLSSPGSGKTSLLVKTIQHFKSHYPIYVIEGDQQTDLDAKRIAAENIPVKQINTGKVCHLDGHGISHALEDLNVQSDALVLIENVGNLICPALFDLGEHVRVVMLSVTEGDDKPLKYPYILQNAHILLINKVDLLPFVDFNIERCIRFAKSINPHLKMMAISTTQEQGLQTWFSWLKTSKESNLASGAVFKG